MKKLLRNYSYIFQVISFTFLYGIYTSVGAVVSYITEPYYDAIYNSLFAGAFLILGVFASFFVGMYLDKTKAYKKIIVLCTIGSMVFIGLSIFTLPYGNVALFTFTIGVVGIFVVPIIPVSYAFAVELTYPIDETVSNGMMLMVSQIFGTLLGLFATVICTSFDKGSVYTIGLFFISSIIAFCFSIFIKEELKISKKNNFNIGNRSPNDISVSLDQSRMAEYLDSDYHPVVTKKDNNMQSGIQDIT